MLKLTPTLSLLLILLPTLVVPTTFAKKKPGSQAIPSCAVVRSAGPSTKTIPLKKIAGFHNELEVLQNNLKPASCTK